MTRISDRRHETSISDVTPGHFWGDVSVGGKVAGIAGFDLPDTDPGDGQWMRWDDATQAWVWIDETDLDGALIPGAHDAEGAIAVRYTFSTTTTDSDPGAGILRLSNATQYLAVTARCDLLDVAGADVTAALALIGDQSGTTKGYLRIQKTDDPTKWLLATVSAIASPAGYRNITIANISKSANSPFADGDPVTLVFVPSTVGLAAGTIPSFAVPTITVGTAAAGAAATVIRSDAVLAKGTPVAVGTANAAGAAGTFADSAHVHSALGGGTGVAGLWDAVVTKASDDTVTNSAVLVNDSELSFAVLTGETWRFEALILYVTDPTGDYKCDFKMSASTFGIIAYRYLGTDATNNAVLLSTGIRETAVPNTTVIAAGGGSLAIVRAILIEGIMFISGNATVNFRFAQNIQTAGQSAVTKAGSRLLLRKLA
jgi:hypothetical protein